MNTDPTILMVDDEAHNLEVYSKIFEKAGYRMKTARNSREFHRELEPELPDLVLLDVNLGKESGIDILQELKSDQRFAYIYKVLISGDKTSPEEQAAGLEMGADGYISRPVHWRELLARVDVFIRHKRTLDELRRSEARFRKIIFRNPDAILIVDREGIIRFANPAASSLFHMEQNKLIGEYIGFPVVGEEKTEVEIVRPGYPPAHGEMRVIDIDWDQLQTYLTTVRDVTSRKEAEKQLMDSEKKYRILIASMPLPLYIWKVSEESFRLESCNDAASAGSGFGCADMGSTPREVFDGCLEIPRAMKRCYRTRKSEEMELTCQRKGTSAPRHFRAMITFVSPEYLMVILNDMTDRMNMESALKRSLEEISGLSARMEQVREEERREISGNLHDDLGQMLTALKMEVVRIHKDLGPGQNQLKKRSENAIAIIDQSIQSIQRITSQLRPPLIDHLGFCNAVRKLIGEFENHTGIRAEVALPEEDPVLSGELTISLYRALQEALTNVIRHSGAKTVWVDMDWDDQQLALRIRDDGEGILKEQVESSESLGLIGMRERIARWNGIFLIAGKKGEGTTIRISVPLTGEKEIGGG